MGGEPRMGVASQQYRTGQPRPRRGSSITRRSRIETTALWCHACQPPRKSDAGSELRSPQYRDSLSPRDGETRRDLDTELYGETNEKDSGARIPRADPSISGQLGVSGVTGHDPIVSV